MKSPAAVNLSACFTTASGSLWHNKMYAILAIVSTDAALIPDVFYRKYSEERLNEHDFFAFYGNNTLKAIMGHAQDFEEAAWVFRARG